MNAAAAPSIGPATTAPLVREGVRGAGRNALLRVCAEWRDRDPRDAVVLSCEPRGGSTWLGEVLAAAEPTAVVWEPLHLTRAPEVAEAGFGWRQFIPADADWPEATALMRRILTGRTLNGWTASASPFRAFLSADRLMVKFCRANALLPWLVRRFAFRRKPIYFLRHPFAIAASQLGMGNFGTERMERSLVSGRFSELRAADAAYIRTLGTDAERIVALWCLANRPPLEDAEAGSLWVRMHYEDLIRRPEREMERLFAAWGGTAPAVVLDRVRKASRMTQAGSLRADPEAQLWKWRDVFDPTQRRDLERVLERFGLHAYDGDVYPAEPAA
jgi:hypothetical protein